MEAGMQRLRLLGKSLFARSDRREVDLLSQSDARKVAELELLVAETGLSGL